MRVERHHRKAIDMSMAYIEPKQPEVKWHATYMGIPIWTDESLPRGTVEFRDGKGNVLGRIEGIEHMRIGAEP